MPNELGTGDDALAEAMNRWSHRVVAGEDAYRVAMDGGHWLDLTDAAHAGRADLIWAWISDLADDIRGPCSQAVCEAVAREFATSWLNLEDRTNPAMQRLFFDRWERDFADVVRRYDPWLDRDDGRRGVLRSLILAYGDVVGPSIEAVRKLVNKSDGLCVHITRWHVAQLIQHYLWGNNSAEDLEQWAGTIEARADIEQDPPNDQALQEVLQDLAHPLPSRLLTTARAEEWMSRLGFPIKK